MIKITKLLTGGVKYESPLCTVVCTGTEGMLCLSGNTEELGNIYNFSWEDEESY